MTVSDVKDVPTIPIAIRLDEIMENVDLNLSSRQHPKLFVIYRNGSGLQLHRDQELIPYFKRAGQNPSCRLHETIFSNDPKSLVVTTITRHQNTQAFLRISSTVSVREEIYPRMEEYPQSASFIPRQSAGMKRLPWPFTPLRV